MDISDVNFEINRRAIPQVEVGRELARGEDGFIRTKTIPLEGSTAYGPYGMTLGRAKDLLENKKHITKNFNKEQLDYLKRFIEQAKLFNKHGYNEKYINANPGSKDPRKLPGYDPRFDYGGRGILDTKRDQELYFQVFDPDLRDAFDKSGGDPELLTKNWHGGDKKSNAEYLLRLNDALKNIRQEMATKVDAFENDSLMRLLGDGGVDPNVVAGSRRGQMKGRKQLPDVDPNVVAGSRSGQMGRRQFPDVDEKSNADAEKRIRQEMATKADAFENDSLMRLLGDGGDPAEPEQSFLDWIINLFNTKENSLTTRENGN